MIIILLLDEIYQEKSIFQWQKKYFLGVISFFKYNPPKPLVHYREEIVTPEVVKLAGSITKHFRMCAEQWS